MKIYLAARYSRRPELQRYRRDLEAMCHTVTSRWLNGGHDLPYGIGEGQAVEFGQRFALEDWADLMAADCCIAFTESASPRQGCRRGGRHVEWGVALAAGKRCIAVGPRENVFYCLPQVEVYPNWATVRAVLAFAGVEPCA